MAEPDPRSQSSWTMGRWDGEKRAAHLISPIYEAGLEGLNKAFAKRISKWKKEDVQVEELYLDDAEYVITAYGIAARICHQVVEDLREEGIKIGMIRPITVFPFPDESFEKLDYSRVKALIDVEMTIPAQMAEDVERAVKGRAPIYEHGHSGGVLLDEYDIRTAVMEIIRGIEGNEENGKDAKEGEND